MTSDKRQLPIFSPKHAAGVSAVAGATAAVACGVCCVLPVAFPAIAAASAGGLVAWLGNAQRWATMLAGLLVMGAWVSVGQQSYRTKKKPAKATLGLMTVATALFALALVWPLIEPVVIEMLS